MNKTAVKKMQLYLIHFYQKITRKKVTRVNVAKERFRQNFNFGFKSPFPSLAKLVTCLITATYALLLSRS